MCIRDSINAEYGGAILAMAHKPGANIERRRREDERVETQKAYAFQANKLSFVALWQEKQERNLFLARTTKHVKDEMAAELNQANLDLVITRRQRLQELYAAEEDQWRRELASHGLGIIDDNQD
eukprot:TRINITY_DN7057_c0_g1_i6.p2 TRINITY_DN7057_c0_g1~~TRINITY_DN7057_c0_g1_i6.p2  ORF type:complete len:124 (+),score=35.13 TRINITY_DN7057_c0_g1_i6:199-570(+)